MIPNTTMATKKKSAPKLRGYGERTDDEKRRALLTDAGLAPPLTAWQFGKLYDLERLAADSELAPSTLRRVLLGLHGKEPIESLSAIATLPRWRSVDGAPTDLAGWRALWAAAHREAEVGQDD